MVLVVSVYDARLKMQAKAGMPDLRSVLQMKIHICHFQVEKPALM